MNSASGAIDRVFGRLHETGAGEGVPRDNGESCESETKIKTECEYSQISFFIQ